jgi:hypothetical protein
MNLSPAHKKIAATALISSLYCLTPFAQSNPEVSPVVQATSPYALGAQRAGIAKCAPRISQVSNFLTQGATNSGVLFNATGPLADQRIVSTSMEVLGQQGMVSYVAGSFSPGSSPNDCSATYDAVTYWPQNCAQVATSSFNAFKPTTPLGKQISVLASGPLVRVFLIPAGTGCVSVKKEVLF